MTTHIVSIKPSRYAANEFATRYDMDTWVSDIDIMAPNTYQARDGQPIRHSLHVSGPDNCSREVQGGPMWQHAMAFLNPTATMIADSPIHQAPTITVEVGDLIVCPERDMVLRVNAATRRNNTSLTVLVAPEPAYDHSAWLNDLDRKRSLRIM